MPRTLWSEKFDESKSAINLPISRELLQVFAKAVNVPKPWSAGYLMALAILDLFDQLSRADVTESEGYRGIDSHAEYDEEMYAFTESMIGKAEEVVYKADVLFEQARLGSESQRPADTKWEPRVEEEIRRMGRRIDDYRFRSGKTNYTALADHLHTLINSEIPPSSFPKSVKTIQRRLPSILGRLGI